MSVFRQSGYLALALSVLIVSAPGFSFSKEEGVIYANSDFGLGVFGNKTGSGEDMCHEYVASTWSPAFIITQNTFEGSNLILYNIKMVPMFRTQPCWL